MTRIVFGVCLAALTVGCAATPAPESLPQTRAWVAAGGAPLSPQSRCPYVADVDLGAIAERQAEAEASETWARGQAYVQGLFDQIAIGEGFRKPPADAPVILRSVEPPGGMYSNTVWAVVWKEADGSWWFWRQNRTNEPPPPPPYPPADDASAEEKEAYRLALAAYPPSDAERWPPVHGRLAPSQAAAVEQALADPCRAWEPDLWPWDPPLRRPRAQPGPPPPPDWTPAYVELREAGRAPRRITAPNERESHAGTLIRVARYPTAG